MKLLPLTLTLSVLLLGSHFASGQALPTATRRGALQVGGDYVADFPDYTNSKFFGYGIYADLDYSEHFGVEFNFKQANDLTHQLNSQGNGNTGAPNVPSMQRTYELGLRYSRNYKRFNPYVRGSIGRGDFEYPPLPLPNPQNVSQGTLGYYLVSPAIGVDYTLTVRLSIRADFDSQHWLARTDSPSPNNINGLPRGLTPFVYSGGIAYRFGYGNELPGK